MKKQVLVFVLGVFILPLGAMAQDHSGHSMKMNNDETTVKHYEVSANFQQQLNAVYKASLALNKSFTASDATSVKEFTATLISSVSKVDMTLLKGEAHMAWMKYLKPISAELAKIKVSDDIEEQRKAYVTVSDGLYKAVKSFGVGETVYYQYCPMAKASWLNDSNDVNNPYYGSKMLKCGFVKEVIN